ncbi:prephenate dehydrogenase [Geovibrio thiophilus]|uniref:Prephenate dehydrogenase n=1 Tax=Geovibrio thiophilus TaxID=139438 RepID=A0A3R5V0N5_9BACT|nr:prephenate dehydrogenase [Geovibrio thiophilus]QAR34308.1 prephenate dehydrogenase [Geovibrio thiophilus]
MAFNSIGIIGLGLIGGSFARAFCDRGLCVYGLDECASTLAEAAGADIFSALTDDMDQLLALKPELIYICVPVEATKSVLKTLAEKGVKTPVTDGASTKSTVCALAHGLGLNFCGGHPIAGREVSGFSSSTDGLFDGAVHVLTPVADGFPTDDLKALHEVIGMRVTVMTADRHDLVFGAISHLPHVTAFSLVEAVNKACPEAFSYTGGGFKDFTRIAASNPRMWTDIFLDNDKTVIELIDTYIDFLKTWREDITAKDEKKIYKRIEDASSIRRSIK